MVVLSMVGTRARHEETLPAASAATTGSSATLLKPPVPRGGEEAAEFSLAGAEEGQRLS